MADRRTVDIDPACPLRGVVVCCTHIPQDQRTDINNKVLELGGIHKYDLTPDVTHLLVGDYDTPKYRHVAKDRQDIKAMDQAWIYAISDLWKRDSDIDFAALEAQWQLKPLETSGTEITAASPYDPEKPHRRGTILCCLTGFDKPARQQIIPKITDNGGTYTADLSRDVTHLVVNKPEGKKYDAAKIWGIIIVTIQWLDTSVERGMILDENCFDPLLPPDQIGKNAWTRRNHKHSATLGKRSRTEQAKSSDMDPRKLRKTASMMKLGNELGQSIWGDILGQQPPAAVDSVTAVATAQSTERDKFTQSNVDVKADQQGNKPVQDPSAHAEVNHVHEITTATVERDLPTDGGMFSRCAFFIANFDSRKTNILTQTINSLDGIVCSELDQLAQDGQSNPRAYRFVIVPQSSTLETYQKYLSLGTSNIPIHIVTEFYVEKCLHSKTFFHPQDHTLGRPFPSFPIPGFDNLTICSAGFTGIDLLHTERAIKQLGANFEERFTPKTTFLICQSLPAVRKEKLRLALQWQIPVVGEAWLWECIAKGVYVSAEKFMFPKLKQKAPPVPAMQSRDTYDLNKSIPVVQSCPKQDGVAAECGLLKKASVPLNKTNPFRHDDTATKDGLSDEKYCVANGHALNPPFRSLTEQPEPAVLSDVTAKIVNNSTVHTIGHAPAALHRAMSTPQPLIKPSDKAIGTTPTTTTITPAEAATEKERRKQVAENRAIERDDLSNKITSLIESATTSIGSANHSFDSNGGNSLGVRTSSGIGGGSGNDEELPANIPSGPVRSRRRQILGRAISNVSAESSASGGGVNSGGDAKEEGQDSATPSTQLEYRDDEAKVHREAVLKRMMGGAEVVSKGGVGTGDRQSLSTKKAKGQRN